MTPVTPALSATYATYATPHPRLLYATILLLSLTEFLQSGMTAFAAAPIMGELGMGPEQFSLVAAIYASVAIMTISMHRWLVEHIGGGPGAPAFAGPPPARA